jgi:phenylacetyl-CoA:acceptor oxidoreductase
MKRSNPRKGRNEDPGFVPISWDEALDTIAERLRAIRKKGVKDEAGLPRVAATFGMGGTPASYMGTFPAFLSAWGPMDFSFGSGQGVKCMHAEHLYGELHGHVPGVPVGMGTDGFQLRLRTGREVHACGTPVWGILAPRLYGVPGYGALTVCRVVWRE